MTYSLLDSGNKKKLEKIGPYHIVRPSNICIWQPLFEDKWEKKDAIFSRKNGWEFKNCKSINKNKSWVISLENIFFKISPTDFGHLGIFPEHVFLLKEIKKMLDKKKGRKILNLFAYTGAASLASLQKNAKVCHVDASKPSILWAKENVKLNRLNSSDIRWILDDVFKFLKREKKRNSRYDGIILDPPTFGRGPKNEVFKIENDLLDILNLCKDILSDDPIFIILSCHSLGFTKEVLYNVLFQVMKKNIQFGDMFLFSKKSFSIPSGSYAIWKNI